MKHTLLVTGASGFVGRTLCVEAARRGFAVTGAVRSSYMVASEINTIEVNEINGNTDWSIATSTADVVIHLAARVHVMYELSKDPLVEFCRVNVAGTERLARSAAADGVKRFVYVSSIKVNGERTWGMQCFTESDQPDPQDPYGVSKWQAELALQRVAQETGLEVVIVRPPLVYGAGVKGNFEQALRIVAQDFPLPLASIKNRRSLVYVGNLVDALMLCATHPDAAGQTYLVGDGEDISTPELLRRVGTAMGHPARLFPCPPHVLNWVGRLTGKSAQIERLVGSLQIDSSKIRRELSWMPPYSLQQGLQATSEWYRAHS